MKAVYPFVTDYRNLLSYTENYSVGVWNKNNVSVTINDIIAPNGTLTGNKIVANSTSNDYIYQTLPTLTNGQIYTVSRYVKAGTQNFCTIGLHALADAYFDLVNLTYSFSGAGAVSASITDEGNGWRRISATYTWTGSTYNVYFAFANSLSAQAPITVGAYQYTWGTQIEVGTLSAYQPVLGVNNYSTNVASQMKFNLVNPQDSDAAFRLAFSGGWTYSTNGAQPNGTNGYADTKFSPSANLTANSSHLSIYSRTAIGNLPQSDMGSYSVAANDAFTLAIAYSNVCYMGSYAFGAAVNYIDFANTDSRGYYINTRTSSTLLKGFKNNILGDTSTTSVTGVLPTLNTTIGAENFNGTATSYSTKQYAFATIGTGLSDAEVAILNQLVTDYETTLNRNV